MVFIIARDDEATRQLALKGGPIFSASRYAVKLYSLLTAVHLALQQNDGR
jgi:hypothetical protein